MPMLKCAAELKAEVKANTSKATKESREAYHRWGDNELRQGVGALHRLTKRADELIEAAVYVHPAKSDETVKVSASKPRKRKRDEPRRTRSASTQERGLLSHWPLLLT